VTHYLPAGRVYICTLDFHLNLDRVWRQQGLYDRMDQQRYIHHIGYTHPPEMPYYRRGYPHALWSSISPRSTLIGACRFLAEVGCPLDSTTDSELFKTFYRNEGRAMESQPVPFLPSPCLDHVTIGQCKWSMSFCTNKMAAGSDGLQIALVILGLLIHLQPEKTDHTDLVDVKAENLGFYACSRFSRDN